MWTPSELGSDQMGPRWNGTVVPSTWIADTFDGPSSSGDINTHRLSLLSSSNLDSISWLSIWSCSPFWSVNTIYWFSGFRLNTNLYVPFFLGRKKTCPTNWHTVWGGGYYLCSSLFYHGLCLYVYISIPPPPPPPNSCALIVLADLQILSCTLLLFAWHFDLSLFVANLPDNELFCPLPDPDLEHLSVPSEQDACVLARLLVFLAHLLREVTPWTLLVGLGSWDLLTVLW